MHISKQISSAIPKKYIHQIYFVYFGLIFTAILEMLSLGTIPIFITLLLDSQSSFKLLNIDLSLVVRNIFGDKMLILFPVTIIIIFHKKYIDVSNYSFRNKGFKKFKNIFYTLI